MDKRTVRNARLTRLMAMRAELDALILDEMEPWQRVVYDYVLRCTGTASADLARAEAMELNHASTMLKQLADLGLLIRYEKRDETGRWFVYYRR